MSEVCEIHKIEMQNTDCRRCHGSGEDDEFGECWRCKGSGEAPYLVCQICEENVAMENEP